MLRGIYTEKIYLISEQQTLDLTKYEDLLAHKPQWEKTGLKVHCAQTADFNRLTASIDKFQDGTRVANRIRRGDLCIVAYKNTNLVYYSWIAMGETRFPNTESDQMIMYLNPDEAYSYDSYTLPKYRRQGIWTLSDIFRTRYLYQQGIYTKYAAVETSNRPSITSRKQRERHGVVRTIGSVTMRSFLGHKRYQFHGLTDHDCSTLARLFRLPPKSIKLAS